LIRLITFDLDNTLWDADPVLLYAEKILYEWLQDQHPSISHDLSFKKMMHLKNKVLTLHPHLYGKVSTTRLQVLKQFFLDGGYSLAESENQSQLAFAIFYQARQQVTLFDGAISCLETLRHRYDLASLSNGNADPDIIGLSRFFQFSLNAEEVESPKPAPDIFLKALALSGLKPNQVIHIGDHLQEDIWAAQQVGIASIWANFKGHSPIAERMPDATITSLVQLPDVIEQLA